MDNCLSTIHQYDLCGINGRVYSNISSIIYMLSPLVVEKTGANGSSDSTISVLNRPSLLCFVILKSIQEWAIGPFRNSDIIHKYGRLWQLVNYVIMSDNSREDWSSCNITWRQSSSSISTKFPVIVSYQNITLSLVACVAWISAIAGSYWKLSCLIYQPTLPQPE